MKKRQQTLQVTLIVLTWAMAVIFTIGAAHLSNAGMIADDLPYIATPAGIDELHSTLQRALALLVLGATGTITAATAFVIASRKRHAPGTTDSQRS